eukprot:3018612-Rhodomonas_salina.2
MAFTRLFALRAASLWKPNARNGFSVANGTKPSTELSTELHSVYHLRLAKAHRHSLGIMIIEQEHLLSRGSSRSLMDKGCNLPNSPAGSLRDLRTTRSGKQYAAPISGRDHPDMDDMANAEPEPKKTETFNMVATFEIYPEWLRKGPWSPLTSVWLVSFSVALLYSFPMALETGGVPETAAPSTGLTGLRVACGAWGLGFCGYM